MNECVTAEENGAGDHAGINECVAAEENGSGDHAGMNEIHSDIRVLYQDCFQHLCIAESIQARHIGPLFMLHSRILYSLPLHVCALREAAALELSTYVFCCQVTRCWSR